MADPLNRPGAQNASVGAVYASFAAVYLIWGSTYLAIRIGIAEIPPFFMASARYLLAGAVLYPLALSRSNERPTRPQWYAALLLGALLPAAGNGFLTWAEQTVPSGIAALLVTMVSLWIVIFEWLRPGGTRPTLRTSLGLILGFFGIFLLIAPWQTQGHVNLVGACVAMSGSICWAAGSVASRHLPLPRTLLLGVAMQSLCGGVVLAILGLLTGELPRVDVASITHRGWLALAYLTVFGSLIGYTAYSFLLHAVPPAQVATYAYVNPVIAVILGWLFAGEALTPRLLIAAPVILVGVILVIASTGNVRSRSEPLPEPENPCA